MSGWCVGPTDQERQASITEMENATVATEPNKPCAHYIGAESRHCGNTDNVRLYLPGPRCPTHTPSAIQGLPEPDAALPLIASPTGPWIDQPIACFDLETTGVDVETDRIVTACVATIENGNVEDFTWIVDPGIDIPEGAAKIHGYTTERAQAEGGDPRDSVWTIAHKLAELLQGGVPVVGMNLAYDLTLLDRELRRHGLPATLPDLMTSQAGPCGPGVVGPIIDVRVLDKYFDPYRRGGRKLTDLCAHYNVRHDGAHNSSADAVAAARVLWAMTKRHPYLLDVSTVDLHRNQVEWSAAQAADFAAYRRKIGKPLPEHETTGEWPIRSLPVTV